MNREFLKLLRIRSNVGMIFTKTYLFCW